MVGVAVVGAVRCDADAPLRGEVEDGIPYWYIPPRPSHDLHTYRYG